MKLFQLECKKILSSRLNLILLVLFTVLSIFFFQSNLETNTSYTHADGSLMSEKEVAQYIDEEKQKWTGAMDEEWYKKLEKEYLIADRRMEEQIYDFKKIENTYGTDWYEDYKSNGSKYVSEDAPKAEKEGRRVLFYNDNITHTKVDIKHEVIWSIYMNYAETMVVKKPWNYKDGIDGALYSMYDNSKTPSFIYPRLVYSKSELLFMKDVMNNKGTFHYGNSKEWLNIIETIAMTGLLLLIWMIFIASDILNKERKKNMLEVLSSCPKGKTNLFFSKVATVIACGMIGTVVMVGAFMVYAGLGGYIGDAMVNMTEGKYAICLFTYGEAFCISIFYLMIGVIIVGTIGVVVSTYIKSSYRSLAVLFLLIFVPSFISSYLFPFDIYLPIELMKAGDMTIYAPITTLFSTVAYTWIVLPMVWFPICGVMLYITWKTYKNRKYRCIS